MYDNDRGEYTRCSPSARQQRGMVRQSRLAGLCASSASNLVRKCGLTRPTLCIGSPQMAVKRERGRACNCCPSLVAGLAGTGSVGRPHWTADDVAPTEMRGRPPCARKVLPLIPWGVEWGWRSLKLAAAPAQGIVGVAPKGAPAWSHRTPLSRGGTRPPDWTMVWYHGDDRTNCGAALRGVGAPPACSFAAPSSNRGKRSGLRAVGCRGPTARSSICFCLLRITVLVCSRPGAQSDVVEVTRVSPRLVALPLVHRRVQGGILSPNDRAQRSFRDGPPGWWRRPFLPRAAILDGTGGAPPPTLQCLRLLWQDVLGGLLPIGDSNNSMGGPQSSRVRRPAIFLGAVVTQHKHGTGGERVCAGAPIGTAPPPWTAGRGMTVERTGGKPPPCCQSRAAVQMHNVSGSTVQILLCIAVRCAFFAAQRSKNWWSLRQSTRRVAAGRRLLSLSALLARCQRLRAY